MKRIIYYEVRANAHREGIMRSKICKALLVMLCVVLIPLQIVSANDKNYHSIIEDSYKGDGLFQVNYSGGAWTASTGYPAYSNGDEHWVNLKPNETPELTVKFIGTAIEAFGTKDAAHGIYEVSVDGGEPIVFDAYAPERQNQQSIAKFTDLEDGEHTLKLVVTGRKNDSATRNSGQVDFFRVDHGEIKGETVELRSDELFLGVGEKSQVNATITPHYATTRDLTWSSSDESIVTVEDGVVTAVGTGEALVSATIDGTDITSSLTFTVEDINTSMTAFIGDADQHYLQKDAKKYRGLKNTNFADIAWRGDRLSSSIVVTSRVKDITNLDATISNFTNGKYTIDASNVEINALKETNAYIGRGFSWGNVPKGPKEMVPDIIHTPLPIDIDQEVLQTLWVSIDVPKDTVPGIYNGTITLSNGEDKDPIILNYEIEVLDLEQPELYSDNEYDFGMDIWQYPFSTARYYGIEEKDYFNDKHMEILTAQLNAYKEVGGDAISVSIVEDPWNQQTTDKYPSMVKWTKEADGTFSFDYDYFDKYVELAMSLGIDKQIKSFSMIPWENRIFYHDVATDKEVQVRPAPGSDLWIELWDQFLTSYVAHLDDKGWFDITYMAMDERPLSTMLPVIEILKSHPNKDGKTLMIHGAMNFNSVDSKILDEIHDISINLGHTNHGDEELRELSEHRRSLGFTTTIYTCVGDYPSSFAFSNPGESAWTMWYTESQAVDGFMRWAFDAWVEDPLTDISHWYWESGDPFFVYPREKDSDSVIPYSTPRYEKLKEGQRDVTKARYLKSLDPQLSKDIEELIQSIGRKYGVGNGHGAAVAASEADKQFINDEVKRMRAGVNELAKEYLRTTKGDTSVQFDQLLKSVDVSELDSLTPESIVEVHGVTKNADGTETITNNLKPLSVNVDELLAAQRTGIYSVFVEVPFKGDTFTKELYVELGDKSEVLTLESKSDTLELKKDELKEILENDELDAVVRELLSPVATTTSDYFEDLEVSVAVKFDIDEEVSKDEYIITLNSKTVSSEESKDIVLTVSDVTSPDTGKPVLPGTGVTTSLTLFGIGALLILGGYTILRKKEQY